MSEISVVVVGSTAINSVVGNGDTVNVSVGGSSGGGSGAAATVQVGKVLTVDATQSASVVNSGTAYAAKLDFSIPRGGTGLTGATGPATTLSIGSVTTGTTAAVSLTGTAPSQQISFVLQPGPTGPANSLSIGSVSTGVTAAVSISGAAPSQTLSFVLPEGPQGPVTTLKIGTVVTGADAAATLTGTGLTQTLNLVLPQGAQGERGLQGEVGPAGPANSLTVGSVTTTTGSTAQVTITGNAPSQQISFVMPRGPQGVQGDAGPFTVVQAGTVTTGASGTQAKVDTVSSGGTVTLNFTIPRGVDGTANLADETPQPLGVPSAGTAGFAARADHVHAVPTISYGSLTGVPTAFTPSAHPHAIGDVTNLQAVLDGKQPVGTYATLVGGTVPSSQLPGFVDDVQEFTNLAGFPATGEVGKLFVARDTNKVYRWSGSTYIEIASSPGSTDSVAEGSTNLYFTTLRAAAAAPVQSVNGKTGNVTIEAGGIAWSTAPTATNTVTKAGSLSYDENFLYIANATDQWRRTSIDDWTTPTITISVQPSNQTAVGGTATFSVTATATQNAELTYQWQRQAGGTGGWANIATGLSATLDLVDLAYAANNGDKYRVIISSGAAGTGGTAVNGWLPAVVVELTPSATVTSGEATLTISAAISIVTQPQSVTLTNGTSAAFNVSATTPGAGLSYQWQSSPDGTNWTAISGATSASYSITGATETGNSGTRYRCVVSSSGYDDATSNAAILTVAPITVTSQPSSQTGTPVAGTTPAYTASFTSAATSPAGAPTIQWEVSTDGGVNYSDVSGQTNSSLALTGLTNADSGKRYRAKFEKSGWNTVRSNVASLTVPTDAITVTQQPSNTTASVSQFSSTNFTLPSGTWRGISYANGQWFATPSNGDLGGDYLATSSDGVNWTKRVAVLPISATWMPVMYGGGLHLTFRNGTSTYATSTDGLTWTQRTLPTSSSSIVYVDGLGWASVGFSATSLYSSTDGVNWTAWPIGASGFIEIVASGSKLVVATSNSSPAARYATISAGTLTSFASVGVSGSVIAASGSTFAFGAGDSFFKTVDLSGASPAVASLATPSSSRVIAAAWDSPRSRWIVIVSDGSATGGIFTANAAMTSLSKRLSLGLPIGGMGASRSAVFSDGNRATAYYVTSDGTTASAGWYTSDDGGLTWTFRLQSTLSERPYVTGGRYVARTSEWGTDDQTTDTGVIVDIGGAVSASLSASASTTFGSPAIQWQQSTDGGATWSDVSNATASLYAFNPTSSDNGKRYRAVFTKASYTTVNSNSAILTVP